MCLADFLQGTPPYLRNPMMPLIGNALNANGLDRDGTIVSRIAPGSLEDVAESSSTFQTLEFL
jgi:hypothetical protein